MLKQLSIKVPLVEALGQMLGYANFMKDLVTKKRSVTFEDDDRMQHCTAISTRSLVQKKKIRMRLLFHVQLGYYILLKHYVIWGSMRQSGELQSVSAISYNMVAALDRDDVWFKPKKFELDMKNCESQPAKPSIEEAPKVELKALPPHLRYEFLGNGDTLPVMIASDPDEQQVQSVVKYILVAVDYVSKWVEAISLVNNEGKSVTAFLKKNIFSRFGIPRAIISDGGSHFCNRLFKGLLEKYGVRHTVVTPYNPQTSG
ncbi:uncharacterized protein [Solanum lycopersicum]|uniref:uncharacterized protein n=1 Tax=Solanum lycopersicum TaxID=4081 RepID=UPI00374951E4